MKQDLVVAIDGPSASGKSTVSRLAARDLGFCYVDSGAFYRGMTWKALRENVDCRDAAAVGALLERIQFELFLGEGRVLFTIDGEDPGAQLRSEAVAEHVSDIAAIPEVRRFMVDRLRDTVRFGNLVMEGRDIGTVVFPDAPFKFYLDAHPEERARRRHQELVRSQSGETTVDNVLSSLTRRDTKDTTRKTAPLQIALGAQVIDSTAMQAEDVVKLIVAHVRTALRA
ncbi:MAG TPA: (d)CMP kinase [Kiritimatiellia bacterium]|jgi:cytidylate kinase